MKGIYLNIGAEVSFQDGAGGTLHKVVVDPQTKQVTDLVIVKGLLQRHDYVIPLSVVEQASENEIQVALYTQELASYPQYSEVEFEEPLDDWEHEIYYPREHVLVWNPIAGYIEQPRSIVPVIRRRLPKGIPFGEEVIGRSSVVRNIDGVVGKIDHLWLDRDSWEITHLIVRRGIVPHYFVIPFSWISTITPQEVFIKGTDTQLKPVPATQLQLLLAYDTDVRVGDEGYLLDTNLVIADEVLDELAVDPRTASSVVEVVHDQGVITLMGEVDNELAHIAAEEIAHRHQGITSVVNALEVRPKSGNLETMTTVLGQLVNHAFGAVVNVDHVPSIH
jgi:uncharacterized protein YrrD